MNVPPDLICHEDILLTHGSPETPKRVIGKQSDPGQTPQNAASDQGLHCLRIVQPFFSWNI